MLTAGINVGAKSVEVVILQNEQLLGYSIVQAGWDTQASTQKAFDEATKASDIGRNKIERVGITGADGIDMALPTVYISDLICSARGAVWVRPSARTVIDIGAEESRALSCDSTGKLMVYVRSDKCAAGVGAFLDEMASLLEVKVEDLGGLSRLSKNEIPLNIFCVIFAESDVISLVHEGASKEDIARAINDATASKAFALLQGIDVKEDVVFIGGVAKNIGVVDSLSKRLNLDIWVPEEPCIITAVGVALIAQQKDVPARPAGVRDMFTLPE